MKIKKNDEVLVTAGKDKGKRGKVDKLFPKSHKVIVGGLNISKRHLKPRGKDQPGSIIDLVKPLPVESVALVCPKCNQATRVGYKFEAGEKVRFCKKCSQTI